MGGGGGWNTTRDRRTHLTIYNNKDGNFKHIYIFPWKKKKELYITPLLLNEHRIRL